jgi:tRNA A37 threonylcarbamoyladenosine dehydratase
MNKDGVAILLSSAYDLVIDNIDKVHVELRLNAVCIKLCVLDLRDSQCVSFFELGRQLHPKLTELLGVYYYWREWLRDRLRLMN